MKKRVLYSPKKKASEEIGVLVWMSPRRYAQHTAPAGTLLTLQRHHGHPPHPLWLLCKHPRGDQKIHSLLVISITRSWQVLFLKSLQKCDMETDVLPLQSKYHHTTVWDRLQRLCYGVYGQRYMEVKEWCSMFRDLSILKKDFSFSLVKNTNLAWNLSSNLCCFCFQIITADCLFFLANNLCLYVGG